MFGPGGIVSKPPLVVALKSARSCAVLSPTPVTLTVTAAPAATVKPVSAPAFLIGEMGHRRGRRRRRVDGEIEGVLVAVLPAGSVAVATAV